MKKELDYQNSLGFAMLKTEIRIFWWIQILNVHAYTIVFLTYIINIFNKVQYIYS